MILMILLLKKIRRVFSDQVNKIVKKKNEKMKFIQFLVDSKLRDNIVVPTVVQQIFQLTVP